MKSFLNLPTLLLFSFLVRTLIFGADFGNALALLALSGLYGFYLFLEVNKQPDINEQTKKDMVQLKNELELVKSALNSVKLGIGFNGRK